MYRLNFRPPIKKVCLLNQQLSPTRNSFHERRLKLERASVLGSGTNTSWGHALVWLAHDSDRVYGGPVVSDCWPVSPGRVSCAVSSLRLFLHLLTLFSFLCQITVTLGILSISKP